MDLRVSATAAVGVAATVVLFIVLSGGDDGSSGSGKPATNTEKPSTGEAKGGAAEGNGAATSEEPTGAQQSVPLIRYEAGEVVGGVHELEFTTGEEIRFKVHSDIADEVHLHGYDVSQEVQAGGTTSFDVPADIEGVFEVELENAVVALAEITVSPD